MQALLEGIAHQHQQLRHGHHVRDVLLSQHPHDVRASATGDVVDGGSRIERVQQPARQLEQVRERQDAGQPTARVERDALVAGLDLRQQIGVRDHAALWVARGSRRKEDSRDLFGRRRPVDARLAPARAGVPPGQDRFAGCPGGRLLVAPDDAARFYRLENAGAGLRVHLAIERHHDGAEFPEREQVDRSAPVVGHPEHDAVARPNPEPRQLSCQRVDQVQELSAGEDLPAQTLLAADGHRRGVVRGAARH